MIFERAECDGIVIEDTEDQTDWPCVVMRFNECNCGECPPRQVAMTLSCAKSLQVDLSNVINRLQERPKCR